MIRLFEYERDGGEKVKIYIVGIGIVPLFFARVRLCLQQYLVGIFELLCIGNGLYVGQSPNVNPYEITGDKEGSTIKIRPVSRT